MPITLATGWIYCDQLTNIPAAPRSGRLTIHPEKPTAVQLISYAHRNYQQKQPVVAKKIAIIVPDKR